MPTITSIEPLRFAGHDCLRLRNTHGQAIIALHGAHLLSWVPTGQQEVLWLSPLALPEPAAIRGGVPICWPWFGKQGMPNGGMQHGPVRNRAWVVVSTDTQSADRISLTCVPSTAQHADDPLRRYGPDLELSLQLELGQDLTQTLQTRNVGSQPFVLTQALHTYFAVEDVTQVRIHGLDGLLCEDKLHDTQATVHNGELAVDPPRDCLYHHGDGAARHQYTLTDPQRRRSVQVTTQGSQSVVVWNPGMEGAANMADVPDTGWREFVCVEAANGGRDSITLLPGTQHQLRQVLSVSSW